MGRISTSPRYVIDITGPDPLTLGIWEGEGSSALASLVLLDFLDDENLLVGQGMEGGEIVKIVVCLSHELVIGS